jgi:FkbM family methyltransferase
LKFLRFLISLLPDGLPLPVLRGPARGLFWLVGAAPGSSKGLSVLWNRSEPEQLLAAYRLSKGKRCCFDLGAHAGLYSLIFARHAQCVCAFEPWPRNIGWLVRTLALNRISNVMVLPWAVSDQSGLKFFQEGVHNSMGRLDSSGATPVFATSLGDFIARQGLRPEVIKIDVEGAETEVLRGGADFLRECKPAILLSVHGPDRRRECLQLSRELGYTRIRSLGNRSLDEADEYCIEA